MRGEYRFLRAQGGFRFARVTIQSSLAEDWIVRISDELGYEGRHYGDALKRGIFLAVDAHVLACEGRYKVVVERLVQTIVDTTDDAVECAAAIATWKSFGHDEAEATLTLSDDRWHVSFDAAAG